MLYKHSYIFFIIDHLKTTQYRIYILRNTTSFSPFAFNLLSRSSRRLTPISNLKYTDSKRKFGKSKVSMLNIQV